MIHVLAHATTTHVWVLTFTTQLFYLGKEGVYETVVICHVFFLSVSLSISMLSKIMAKFYEIWKSVRLGTKKILL